MGKILEKIIYDRVMFWLRSSPVEISPNQFGFTPQKSAEDAINEVVRRQRSILQNGRVGIIVSLDISGAFDTAWWALILHSLKTHRIPGNIYRLIQNYFTNRQTSLYLCGRTFSKGLSRGCPQGAKCSPLFWLLLFNNLLNIPLPEGCYLIAFADDLLLICDYHDLTICELRTNEALRRIVRWVAENKLTFNPVKTQAMFITSRRKLNPPSVVVNDVQIELVNQIKYLGVILDRKLLWNAHIDYIIKKCEKMFHAIARTSGKDWGLSAGVLRVIYIGAIEPMLTYASSAWKEALQKITVRRRLLSMQRLFAMRITRSRQKVSLEALLILADLVPIDLKLGICSSRYLIRQGQNPPCLQAAVYQKPASLSECGHPAIKPNFVKERCSNQHLLRIYTDGSKMEGKTGCAFVVYQDRSIIKSSKIRLADFCSVFQAELLAIKEAVTWAHTIDAEVSIFTDSMSSLQAIDNWQNRNRLVMDIREILVRCKKHICLAWNKAHVGIEGNEQADKLAKEATREDTVQYALFPLSHALGLLYTQLYEQWNARWTSTSNGQVTKQFFRSVQERRQWKSMPDYVLTQFLTGHGFFAAHQVRIGRAHNPRCVCGEEQTSLHLIQRCPALLVQRVTFEQQNGVSVQRDLLRCLQIPDFIKFLRWIFDKFNN